LIELVLSHKKSGLLYVGKWCLQMVQRFSSKGFTVTKPNRCHGSLTLYVMNAQFCGTVSQFPPFASY